MEPRPGGSAAVVAAALLLLLLGTQGQASTPSPRCDCGHNSHERNGLVCCRGCPAGHYLKAPCTEACGAATCLPCPQGTFLAWENHHETRCARCQACDEQAPQVALKNCSAVADTHCGCKPGWFTECVVSRCLHGSPFRCRPCTDCGALHRHVRVPCSSRDTQCGTCLPGFYEYGNSCVSCPTSTLGSCPEPCVAVCGWRQMFWVQVLLAGLVVPLLLGATLTYTYRRCRPCKPKFPDKAGTEALTSLQATHVSPSDSAHTFLAPPSSSEKVCTVQLVGNSWTSGPPQTQEAPCPEVTWSWDQLPSRALGKGFQWPEALAPFSQVKVRSCGFLKHHLPTSYPLTDQANLPARLGPAPAPAPPRVPHWLSPAARRPAAASAHAPCRLGGHHAPARPTTLRRDGRGARAALEGVRAHAGAARGGDRGGGGGGRPLPRPAIRDAQALAPATARGLGRRLCGSGAHGPGRLRRGPAESLAAGPVMLETTPTPRLWWPLQKP
ncbi:tumor necrosis factor receptor superfamily member 25 isoform X2 [Camelus dromedarius]|uniref:tumor necrosis factor receptor superfamily member 25 isoform X2 n=1 Tax=Camelus dromedarius TaxID=9838 RepID=UPI0031197AE2